MKYEELLKSRKRSFLTLLLSYNIGLETLRFTSSEWVDWLHDYYNSLDILKNVEDIPFFIDEYKDICTEILRKSISGNLYLFDFPKFETFIEDNIYPKIYIPKEENFEYFKYIIGSNKNLDKKICEDLNLLPPNGVVYGLKSYHKCQIFQYLTLGELKQKKTTLSFSKSLDELRKFTKKKKNISSLDGFIINKRSKLPQGLIGDINCGFFELKEIK